IEGELALAIGVGDPKLIKKISDRLRSRFLFPNLIHPSVIGNFSDIKIGDGNIITANCVFTTSIKIGSFNLFNLATTVGHDVLIGNCNVINPAVNISGGVSIGSNNLIGVNATILQYKVIGSNSIVGACSLVTKNVDDNVTVMGVPAKILHKIN
ncbi:hexapeptide transferase, partial [Chitinophaga sp.]|uniref:hexapeptide transferase n=1 Tax=Chitinophaga sp. TaxID=1869181 RepID=UPI002F957A33